MDAITPPTQRMRIAYLTGEYPRVTDTFIQREVAAMRERGHDVITMSIRRPAKSHSVGPEQEAERERTVYVLPPSLLGLMKDHAAALWRSPGTYVRALALAWRTKPAGLKNMLRNMFYFGEAAVVAGRMRREGRTHLHNHFANSSCSVAMLAAEMGGFTYSFTIHGPAIFFEPVHWRVGEKVKRALFVSCISHFCRSQTMVFADPQYWDKLHIVHCGVDPAAFEPRVHAGRGTRLLYVGRLAAVKGLPVLLDAVAGLAKTSQGESSLGVNVEVARGNLAPGSAGVTLTVVGDGPDRAWLEGRAVELGIADRVEFVGFQSQAQVRGRLAETDVFVMSSFAEGVPVVLMEAMAAGVPPVATRIAGVAELVEHEHSGLLVPPGDVDALSDAMTRLIDDADLRNRFALAGRAKVEAEFDIHKEAGWLAEVMTTRIAGERLRVRALTG